MNPYFVALGKCAPPTPERERELAALIKSGDADARREMVEHNLRLVVSVARWYSNRVVDCSVPIEELISEGHLGLLAAVDTFDPRKGYRFSTYATRCIHRKISRMIFREGVIRIPERVATRMRGWEWEPPPAGSHWADLKASADKVKGFAPINNDVTAGKKSRSHEEVAEDAEEVKKAKARVKALLSRLKKTDRRVIELRFGIPDGAPMMLKDVGKVLGVSKERARQKFDTAMTALRHSLKKEKAA